MARIRTIKPEVAAHEVLFDLEKDTGLPIRFAWCMLFTVADREGRFAWRPRTLKAQIIPHDEVDFSRVLDAWVTRGFIVKYRVANEWFGWIPTFTKHQVINNRESPSDLPSIDDADESVDNRNNNFDASSTREARDNDASSTREVHAQAEGRKEGKEGKEGKERNRASTTRAAIPEFHQQVINAYHRILPDLPGIKIWTDRRRKALDRRIAERLKEGKPADTLGYWEQFFERVAGSDFLSGRSSKWHADLEWLIQPENFTKVIEGRYWNPTNGGAHPHGS